MLTTGLMVIGMLKSILPMHSWNPALLLQQMTVCWQFTEDLTQVFEPPSELQQYGVPVWH